MKNYAKENPDQLPLREAVVYRYVRDKYVNPQEDFPFKKVFGDKNRLLNFLNTLLDNVGKPRLTKLRYLQNEKPKLYEEGKTVVFDLKVEDETGNSFIIEMQKDASKEFAKRLQYYAAVAYTDQAKEATEWKKLLPVVVVAVVGNTLHKKSKDALTWHKTTDQKGQQLFGDLEYILLELGKIKDTSIRDDLTAWTHFFLCAGQEKRPPQNVNAHIVEAYETLESALWTREEWDAYLRICLTETQMMDAAAYAKEEGIQIGMEKGIEQGKEEGEKIKMMAMIAKMMAKNMSDAEMAEMAEISFEELRSLKREMGRL
jgi:predicted transposase/invertase (TIGR01784 family)